MIEELRELYEYDRWANARVLDACATLTTEQFTRDLRNSFPSVRETLVHILGADWVWLARWNGTSPSALPAWPELDTLDGLRAKWHEIEAEQVTFLDALTDAQLHTAISYRNFKGEAHAYPLWVMLRHKVNHSSYHRGQITTMLRQLGREPTSTDLLRFYDARQADSSMVAPGR